MLVAAASEWVDVFLGPPQQTNLLTRKRSHLAANDVYIACGPGRTNEFVLLIA